MKLNPAVRTGLIWAGVHQAIILCGVATVFVSEDLFTTFGICLGLIELPTIFVAVLLRDAGYIAWHMGGVRALPSQPIAALHYYADAMLPFAITGALQWFLIGYAVGAWRSKREAREQKQQNLV